jgi:hypothetical protein
MRPCIACEGISPPCLKLSGFSGVPSRAVLRVALDFGLAGNDRKLSGAFALIVLTSTLAGGAAADLPLKRVLTLKAAKTIAAAAETEANKRGATVVIAVVDDGGHLLLPERLDNTQVASVDVAVGKAAPLQFFAGPARTSKTRSRMAVPPHWFSRALRLCREGFPSLSTERS